jgi:hypothetical protein
MKIGEVQRYLARARVAPDGDINPEQYRGQFFADSQWVVKEIRWRLATENEVAQRRLIAAAPELLEACQRLMDHEPEKPLHAHNMDMLDVFDKARQAIAKADPAGDFRDAQAGEGDRKKARR